MLCDVCNVNVPAGEGERVSPDGFRFLLENGFGVHESNLRPLIDRGMRHGKR